MVISIATANLYHIPFEKALSVIRNAGYEYIELDGYWKGGDWEIAQHLKGVPPKDVLHMVRDSGLRIASYHDLGGIIDENQSTLVAPQTYDYLALCDFPYVVLHTPHCKTNDDEWWDSFRPKVANELHSLAKSSFVCIENMNRFKGYQVPLLSPVEMFEFTSQTGVFINFDTTHFAEEGEDIAKAAEMLKSRIKAVHLSDHGGKGATHLFPGEGKLDLKGFIAKLDIDTLQAVTVECNSADTGINEARLTERYARAREYAEALFD